MKAFILLFLILLGGCATSSGPIHLASGSLKIEIIPGAQWQSSHWMGPIPVPMLPQLAVWVQGSDGKVRTLFASNKAARHTWLAAPGEGRPEALPVWNHLENPPGVDAVGSATPPPGQTLELTPGDLPPGTYTVFLEVNKSFDFNENYPETPANPVNGQPSLVYQGQLTVGEKESSCTLQAVGTGALDGQDGQIHPPQGLTTALQIVQSAMVTHSPPGLLR